jgi:hypothetical protein
VVSHSPAPRTEQRMSLLGGSATGQAVLWISVRSPRSRRRPRRSRGKRCGIGFGPDRCFHGLRPCSSSGRPLWVRGIANGRAFRCAG